MYVCRLISARDNSTKLHLKVNIKKRSFSTSVCFDLFSWTLAVISVFEKKNHLNETTTSWETTFFSLLPFWYRWDLKIWPSLKLGWTGRAQQRLLLLCKVWEVILRPGSYFDRQAMHTSLHGHIFHESRMIKKNQKAAHKKEITLYNLNCQNWNKINEKNQWNSFYLFYLSPDPNSNQMHWQTRSKE